MHVTEEMTTTSNHSHQTPSPLTLQPSPLPIPRTQSPPPLGVSAHNPNNVHRNILATNLFEPEPLLEIQLFCALP